MAGADGGSSNDKLTTRWQRRGWGSKHIHRLSCQRRDRGSWWKAAMTKSLGVLDMGEVRCYRAPAGEATAGTRLAIVRDNTRHRASSEITRAHNVDGWTWTRRVFSLTCFHSFQASDYCYVAVPEVKHTNAQPRPSDLDQRAMSRIFCLYSVPRRQKCPVAMRL
ncbi:hypothetical protein CC86DRAFT_116382 [Ophiobolus disseminans]|uniref:Uncharacterized protein n=1 Tax=Ophiobolus disseminans TaxID=1469910 RepID=A0A6A6ZHV3_9PLEO|nr:hypothetical protein CC86DRAFT_116382 [Ophiobolus disseminans]